MKTARIVSKTAIKSSAFHACRGTYELEDIAELTMTYKDIGIYSHSRRRVHSETGINLFGGIALLASLPVGKEGSDSFIMFATIDNGDQSMTSLLNYFFQT